MLLSNGEMESLSKSLGEMGKRARQAAAKLGALSTKTKDDALLAMAGALRHSAPLLLHANGCDLEAGGKSGLSGALMERLTLNEDRIEVMAAGLEHIASLPDPVWEHLGSCQAPSGLEIQQVRVPFGVVGIIYESRPNVTADATGLCLKAGNAVILKGGREAFHSNRAIAKVIDRAAREAGIPGGAIQFFERTDREAATALMKMDDALDVLIPRGGKGLKKAVREHATVPVIMTGMGLCHLFIDESADAGMARDIAVNAKVSRPATCNSIETLLVHEKAAPALLPLVAEALFSEGVELRGDERACSLVPCMKSAVSEDWETEYLDLVLSVKVVASLDAAVDHINRYGTGHSEAIVTRDYGNAQTFLRTADAAAVYVNASTRYTDGGEFGFGAEMGISTQKLHARGPMGLKQLTSVKYVVRGEGQVRW